MRYRAAILALLAACSANASITEGGRGILYGNQHAFAVTAKTGWVIDNQSAVNQGLHMVFYPKGKTWNESPAVIYGRSVSTLQAKTIKDQVEITVRDFRENDSPNYSSTAKPSLTLSNGKKANVYYYSGDQWGNYEAVAYIQETEGINFLVFNTRSKDHFDKYIADFLEIASSYQDIYSAPEKLTTGALDKIRRESALILTKPGGKEYESKSIQAVGNTLTNAMRDCTAYLSSNDLPPFSYYVRINPDGRISDARVFPATRLSACFKGLMSSARYPTHEFNSFVLQIEMKVTP